MQPKIPASIQAYREVPASRELIQVSVSGEYDPTWDETTYRILAGPVNGNVAQRTFTCDGLPQDDLLAVIRLLAASAVRQLGGKLAE
jgi:hypothetical protein